MSLRVGGKVSSYSSNQKLFQAAIVALETERSFQH